MNTSFKIKCHSALTCSVSSADIMCFYHTKEIPPLSYLPSPSPSPSDPATGESPLHVAVSLNHEATVSQLLDCGSSLSVQDLEGKTPVMKACEYGHLQALECLAQRGINASGQ